MGRHKDRARVQKWRGKWYLFWFDHLTGKPRRKSCASLKARTAEQRRELLREYRSKEVNDAAEVYRRGGLLAYETELLGALGRYRSDVEERKAIRKQNPKGRQGLGERTADDYLDTLDRFEAWLNEEQLTTGQLDPHTLASFFRHLSTETAYRGSRPVKRSSSTLNRHRRNMRACINYLAKIRPPLFPDIDLLRTAFKPTRTNPSLPSAYTPSDLTKFLRRALEREDPKRKAQVKRKKKGCEEEEFEQTAPSTGATPVSQLFLMLALTGCRRGEALTLEWGHLDLKRGHVHILASKTGRRRIVPLIGAPEGDVAPRFLKLLRRWHEQANGSPYVLPHEGFDQPLYNKTGWRQTNKLSKGGRIIPQGLRQNFTSYAASLGVPPIVAAMWQGHSADVAERWYRAQVLERKPGKTFEDVMGLTPIIEKLLSGS